MVLRWRTTVSIAAKDARSIAAHVDTLATDRGPAGAHAACALVKLAYASPHHRSKIIQAGALKPLVELLRDGAEAQGGPGFSAVGAACQVVGVLAHDPGMAEIIVAAGASEPLVELLRDGAESGGGPGFSAVGAACQVVGVLAHDPGMAEIIVAAGASAPLVELLSTEAAAAAATAIQTLATNGVAFAPARAPLQLLLADGDDRARCAAGSALTALGAPKVRLESLEDVESRFFRIVTPS